MVKLLIDSMCDLPKDLMDDEVVDMVSLNVLIEGKAYRDKKEINLEQVHKHMRSGIMPTTSHVTPGDFKEAFEIYAKKNVEVLYLAFSSKLSGSYDTGVMVLNEVIKSYPNFKCEVVDSCQSGGGIGLIAEQLIIAVKKGMGLLELKNYAEKLKEHVLFYFSVQDLKWLHKGGRVSKSSAIIGDLLKIRPIVLVDKGSLSVIDKVRGDKKAVNILIDKVKERMENLPSGKKLFVDMACIDINESQEMVNMVKEKLLAIGAVPRYVVPIGAVLATHLGLQGAGVYYWGKDPDSI